MEAGFKQKTRRVMRVEVDGYVLICVCCYYQKRNPYHLYLKRGTHVEQLARYANFISVVERMHQWMHENYVGYSDGF